MSPNLPVLAFAVAMAAALPRSVRADSVRCAGGIVSTGDTKLDLLGKCGPPALADRAGATRAVIDARVGTALRVAGPVEIWTYDFGKSRFTQLVRIEKGRITSIERGSYGYAEAQPAPVRPGRATCEPAALSEGALELDVLARCGEPPLREEREEEVAAFAGHAGQVVVAEGATRPVRLLTYDFGPNRRVRVVRIEDGKVARVETAGYGYAR